MSNTKARLLFTPKALPLILKAFGKSLDEDGIIRDSETGESIKTPEGDILTKYNFGGIKKGSEIFIKKDSEIFIKKDLLSAIKLTEGKY